MIGHSIPEYLFIRLCIFGLQSIAPLCTAYLLYNLYHGTAPFASWFGCYASVEALFYFCVYLPRHRILQKAANHPPLISRKEREALFARCFARIQDMNYASGWFYFTDYSEIKRENMIEWILWALFGVHRDGYRTEWEEEIEGYIVQIEKLLGRKLESGWDDAVQCMKVSLDPVVMSHRPLLWYTIVALIDVITWITFIRNGFQHFSAGGLLSSYPPRLFSVFSQPSSHPKIGYYYRPHRSSTKVPVLFIHGIGIGLWPYTPFLKEIAAADPDVGIIAIEIMPVSMRITSPPLSRGDMLAAIAHILDRHEIQRVVVASHSYGTIIAAHMLREPELAERIAASIMVDPIPFLLHLPAVAYNFVYRMPNTANEWQLWYFASRDPDISRALARHFFWAENILFKEDVHGHRLGVVLSGRDQIVDAKEVKDYMTDSAQVDFKWEKDDLTLFYYPDLDHAQVFDTKDRRRPMVELVSKFVRGK